MEKRSRSNWYEPLPPRNWRLNMIPGISRPSSRISRTFQQSLQESDWSSLRNNSSKSRSSSRTQHSFDSRLSYKKKRATITRPVDIDDIFNTHRPLSVSLTKYEPLPAINSSFDKNMAASISSSSEDLLDTNSLMSPRSASVSSLNRLKTSAAQNSSRATKSFENDLDCILDDSYLEEEQLDLEMGSTDSLSLAENSPPKLLRSRTFDVLETAMTNLPVIDSQREMSAVKVTIDGIPLLSFLGQSSELSRPSSHSSLITHPGTPDSGFEGPSTSISSVFTRDQNTDDDSSESDLLSVSFILPDLTFEKLSVSLNLSLGDFLTRILSTNRYFLVDNVDEKLLSKSLLKLGFGTVESVQLIRS